MLFFYSGSDNVFRVYDDLEIYFNGFLYTKLWIDPHYEEKHAASINDELIIDLVNSVDQWVCTLNAEVEGYAFYEVDARIGEKMYRLILVIPSSRLYIGVRNAYRR